MAYVDHSLYVHKSDKGIVVITIYVDDLIVGGDSLTQIENVKSLLKQKFDMKDLGDLRYFLGIEVIRTDEGSMHWICCQNMVWLIVSQYQCH